MSIVEQFSRVRLNRLLFTFEVGYLMRFLMAVDQEQ